MANRINTVMQTCFFALSGVLPKQDAIAAIKQAIRKTYGKKGDEIVAMNIQAVDTTLENLYEVPVGDLATTDTPHQWVPDDAPPFVRSVLAPMMARQGDDLPVSAYPWTAPTPAAPANTRSATSVRRCPFGIPTCACSAASASWFAPTG
jgi:pyruvate-ferredoxin/flavodoxin oxidoreductase